MKLADARQELNKIGFTIIKTQDNEYRVNRRFACEESACYETDIQVAIDTAKAMHKGL